MRAVEISKFGGPDVLEVREVPEPVPGPGEVVVDTVAADVLFLDTQLRAGWGDGFFPLTPPYVPGDGVAGQVGAVGEGVSPQWQGRRVVARTGVQPGQGAAPAPTGGYADRAVAAVSQLVEVPDGLDLPVALALLHDGPTALGLAGRARLRDGEWVLVTAAGGSLGVVLTQLATAAGGRVIGAARGQRKLDLARENGAEVVVDYTEPDWPERVREATAGDGVQVVFDGAGGAQGRAAFEVTGQGGRFFAYGAASGDFATVEPAEARRRGVTLIGITDGGDDGPGMKALADEAVAAAAAGRITPYIGQTFPLERAADAHTAIAARTTIGKTLLLTS